MTRPEVRALYNRLLATSSEDGIAALEDALMRVANDARKDALTWEKKALAAGWTPPAGWEVKS